VNLIEELLKLQEAHGYLRREDLHALRRRAHIPLYEIEGVASFYPHFRRTPPSLLRVTACRDLSCALRHGAAEIEHLRSLCAERDDVSFKPVSCLGRCDSAPACTLNETPLSAGAVPQFLDDLASLPPDEPTAEPRRWRCDPYASAEERYGVLRSVLRNGSIDDVIDQVEASGLRGMGGAGFPTGRKWRGVREAKGIPNGAPKYAICNADESEPGTFKDRVILEELPHLVIEGLALAALAVGAEQGWIYLRHEYRRERIALRRALESAYASGVLGESVCGSGRRLDLEIFVSPGGYILGEETALLEALEGRRGEPRNRPPYPSTRGLYARPTLINNVETLAFVPRIIHTGRADLKFFSVSGDVSQPGVHEVSLGTTLHQLVERCGGMRDDLPIAAFLPGGPSTGFLRGGQADIPMEWGALSEAGSALGSGAVVVLAAGRDLLAAARNLTSFFRNESCGKCVPCRLGTQEAVTLLDDHRPGAFEHFPMLHEMLARTSICGLGQAALVPVTSLLERFPEALPGRMLR
jgi:NADH:ubiquinone oxidoreductase subunit F (NADH-binding)/NADH:ubiquinone oxidoreductase subunit E